MPRRPLLLESCEDRILCSATAPADAPEVEADSAPATSTHVQGAGDEPAPAMTEKAAAPESARHEIVFVDASTQNYEQLVADIRDRSEPGTQTEVVLLDGERDGIAQISGALAGRSDIDAIHILSHGTAGSIKLGNVWLTPDQLANYGTELQSWRGALSADADLLIYGCEVAGDVAGQQLLTGLSQLTGADVNASTDNTGSALFGGNWQLEFATGAIETNVAVSAAAQQSYVNLLNVAVDSASSASANGALSVTVAHTTSGTNRLMIVSIAFDPHGTLVTSVTNNGTALTLIGASQILDSHSRVEYFAMLAPPTGTSNVVVNFSGNGYNGAVVGVMTFTGVNQTIPYANFASGGGDSATPSVTVASRPGDLVFASYSSHGGALSTPGAGQTEHYDTLSAGATASSGSTKAGAASVSNTWTTGSDDWTAVGISILSDANPPPTFNQTPGLWLSSVGNALSGAGSGGSIWDNSTVVQLGNPNLAFEPGVSNGTFSTSFDIDNFAADNEANLRGLYVVKNTITVGSGANTRTLQAGDVLLTTVDDETLGNVVGTNNDLWVYRPNSPGDYSGGSFSILLNNPTGANLHDISLVEKAITVGGITLNAGDFLYTDNTNNRNVMRYQPTGVGSGTTTGTSSVFINGATIGISQDIAAMEFVNETFTLGGRTFQAGQVVMSLVNNDTTVGSNNLATTKFDLFTLDVTQAGATTIANASLLLQGADAPIGISANGEEFDALALFLPTPIVTITNPTVTEGTNTHAVFTISLSNASVTATTFSLALANGTATGGGTDFGAGIEVSTDGGTNWTSSTTATIAAGATSVMVRTPINNDVLDENAETFTLTATRTAGSTIEASVTGTATINDNDPQPTISINDVTVDEGAGTATFTVSLNTASGLPVGVNYSMTTGTAGAADFTAGSGTVNFAAGQTTQTIVVPILNDTFDEPDETFTVNLASPTNATIADGTGIGTITDNDLPPSLTINDVTVNEGAGTATFTVTLSAASSFPVSVAYSTSDGSALAGVDYTAASGTLSFAAGVTTQTFTVPILEDSLNETGETFTVNLASPTNATIADAQGVGTITDNDATPTLSIDDVTRNEAAGTITFTVSLSAGSGQAVSVAYAATSGTATSGTDFAAGTNPLSGTLTFAAGVTSQTITLGITDDPTFENSESFNVTLSSPTNATIADGAGVGTILDNGGGSGGTDNDTPMVSMTDPTVTEGIDAFAVFTLSLSNPSATPVSFNLALGDGTATGGGVDYGAGLEVSTDGGTNWNSATTATIGIGLTSVLVRTPINNDLLDEAAETFTLTATRTSGTTTNASVVGTATITDDDAAPSLIIDDVTVNEGAGTATFTVTLSAASGLPVSVNYATSNGTALAGSDYSSGTGTLIFAAGVTSQTITVAILNDAVFENSEAFTVLLSSPVNATIADNSGLGTILDNGGGAGGTDDDTPALAVSSVTATEGTDTHAVFTVSLSQPSTTGVSFSLALTDGTAVGGGVDFGSGLEVSTDGGTTWNSATSATISPGNTSVLVRTPITDDPLNEAPETFTLTATRTAGTTTNLVATGAAAILNNDAPPALVINDVTVNEGAGNATFTVTLGAASGQTVTVNYATSSGTATAGADFTAQTGTLTFAPGVLSQTITVPILDDATFENSEAFTVTLSGAVNASIADATGTGTILDDGTGLGGTDNDIPTLSVSNPVVAEATPFAVFTVSLSNLSTTPVVFDLALANGTATGGGVDFGAGLEVSTDGGTNWTPATSATIAAGTTSVLVRTAITDDLLDEAPETFTLTATRTAGTTSNLSSVGTATITDNDATPSLSINDVTVNEGAGTATFTVTLNAASGQTVTVNYATSDGTAIGGADFTNATGTLTFATGVTSQTITVPIVNDATFEQSENFTITLSGAVNATIADGTGLGTILDDGTGTGGTDDDRPSVEVSDVTVVEGLQSHAVFTVSLSNLSTTDVTVDLALANGTATGGGVDFGSALEVSIDGGANWIAATSATIAAGMTSVLVRTPITNDALNEAAETFTLTATRTAGTTTNLANSGTATVIDDDGTPALSISDVTVNEAAGTAVFTVSLSAPSGLTITVNYATAGGTAVAGADFATASGVLTFAPGVVSQTVSVSILNDTIFENSEAFTVALGAPTNATIADGTGVGTILDNGTGGGGTDNDRPSFSVSNAAVTEGTDPQAVFTVSLSNLSTTDVTFNLALANGTATGGGVDFGAGLEVSTDGGTIWNPATTATIVAGTMSLLVRTPITNDALDEAAETFTLTATRTAGTTTNTAATGTATITDDDATPSLTINDVTVNEAAGTASFTVTLNAASGQTVTVNYATSAGTAATNVDFGATSGTLTFAPGVTTQTVSVSIFDDALFELSETFLVALSAPVNATVADGSGTGTILDDGTGGGGTDNDTPTLAITDINVVEGTDNFAVFTLSLSNPATTPVILSLALANGTATGGGVDYGAADATNLQVSTDNGLTWNNATTVTIAAGTTSVLVRTSINDDATSETLENFTLTATSGAAVVGSADQIYTLQRLNDYRALVGAAPLVMDALLNAFALESSEELMLNNLAHDHFDDAIAAGTLFTTDGFSGDAAENQGDPFGWPPAVGGVQQQIDEILAAMFAEGPGGVHYDAMIGSTFGRVGIGLVLDGTGLLFFTNDFSGPTSATTNLSVTGTATIADNDGDPTLAINNVTVNEAAGSATFTVTMSKAAGFAVDVNFATASGTATSDADFTGQSGTLHFAAGVTSQTITIDILNDVIFELSESFTVTLSGAVGAAIADGIGVGTILDNGTGGGGTDNDRPTLSVSNATVTEGTNTHAEFTVSLSNPATIDVTFNLALANGTATGGGTDFGPGLEVSTDGGTTWNPTTTATIVAGTTSVLVRTPITDDALDELAIENFTLTATRTAGPVNPPESAVGTATINDNDATPTLAVDDVTVNEDAGTITFTVTLSAASGLPVSVAYAATSGTATSGADFTAGTSLLSGTLTFAAGVTSQTITLGITDDTTFENSESFNVTLSSPTNATIADGAGVGTILDNGGGSGGTDNDTPTLSVTDVSVTEGTNTHAEFLVSLSNLSTTDVTFDLALANGTATGGGVDFGAGLEVSTDGGTTWNPATSATIAAETMSVRVRTPIINDLLDENLETFTLTATRTAGTTTNPSAVGTATITDNDATPSLTINDVIVNEAAGTVTFTVTLSAVSGLPVTVEFATGNDTATAPADYTSTTGTVIFAPGVTSQTIQVTILDDAIFELSESFVVTLSNASNATISDPTGTGTIRDDGTGAGGTDDDTPELTVSNVTATEGTDTHTVFEVSLSNLSTTDVSFSLALANGTATGGGVDFGPGLEVSTNGGASWTSATSATIAAGTTSLLVRTPITNDLLDEAPETFTLIATRTAGITKNNVIAEGTATINDDDATPALAINDVTVNEGAGTATFTVTLSAASGQTVTVDYATSSGTATSGTDFDANSGTLTFAPGVLSQTITVAILDDAIFENSESYTILLSAAVNSVITDGTGVGTILDNGLGAGGTDNDTPALSVSDVTATEGTDGFAVFIVSLSNLSTADVSVALALATGTATGGGVDFGAGLEVLIGATWTPAASATIAAGTASVMVRTPIIDDALNEAPETFTLTATRSTGTTTNLAATGTGTINDNDALPSLTISDVTVNEGAGTATFTVTLSAPSGQTVTVNYATSSGTATSGTDFGPELGVVTFNPGVTVQTIEVSIVDDAIFENSETFNVTLGTPVNATISDNAGVGTILDNGLGGGGTDNDTPSFSVSNVVVMEGTDGFAVFEVSLSNLSTTDVTVALALANVSALGGGVDYGTSGAGNLQVSTDGGTIWVDAASATIAAGSASVLVRTPITDDVLDESAEIFRLNATRTAGSTTNLTATGTAAIADNDGSPALSINDVTVNEAAGTATFTVTLSAISGRAVTVDYATSDGSAEDGIDFTGVADTLTFAPGETTKTVVVSIANDAIFEGSETFFVILSGPGEATILDDTGIGTILDDGTGDGGTDNDTPTLSVTSASATEGTNTHAVFTLSLSNESATDVTMALALTNGTALGGGTDYGAAGAGNLQVSADGGTTWTDATVATIAAGTTSVLVRTPITDDLLDENAETFTLTATRTVGTTTNLSVVGTATITDNDTPPALSIGDVTVDEGAGTATFTVSLSGASGLPITVDYTMANGTAGALDYTAGAGTVSFAAGETTQTIVVPILEDTIDELDETFTVILSNPSATATIADGTGTGTILDNDATPTLSIDDVTRNEAAGTMTFTVSLSTASGLPVSVNFATSSGTATSGADFNPAAGTLNFAPGETTKTVVVTILNDTIFEQSEGFNVTLSAPVNAALGDDLGIGTILDDGTGDGGTDNDTPTLSVSNVTVTEGTDPFAVFSVSLNNLSTTPVSFNLALANVTGTGAGTDYGTGGTDNLQVSTDGGTTWNDVTAATIAAGTTGVLVRTPITDDLLGESNETFILTATVSAGTTTNLSALGTGTVIDDDTPSLSVDDVTINEGAGTVTFTVSLTIPSALPVSVNYATADGTATAGADYTATSGTLNFAPGETTQTIVVPITNDTIFERSESFSVNLTAPVNAAIADATGIGTILDDGTGDGGTDNDTPTLSIDNVSVNEGAGTATFTVTLSAASALPATVDYTMADGTATTGADYTATSGTVSFAAGETTQTITVPISDDLLDEAAETFTVNLANPTNATILDGEGIGTIVDNDAPPSMTIDDVTVDEAAGSMTFTVSLSAASGLLVTVDYGTSNGTATAADYTTTLGTLNFAPGETTKTITVPILEDALDEAAETLTMTLSNALNTTITDATGIGTITDNDAAPTLSINDMTVDEAAGTASFTVTLSAASGQTVTAAYTTADGTATAGADYTVASGTVSFAPGELTQTITVPILEDLVDEAAETFTVNLATPTNATIADVQGVGTITDNDGAPEFSINDVTVNEGAGTATFTVTRTGDTGLASTVDYSTAVGTAGAADLTAASGTLTFAAGVGVMTVTVPIGITDDTLFEGSEQFFVNLSNATNATIADAQGVGTIVDNDTAPAFSINDVAVNEAAGTATFTVTRTGDTGLASTVDYSTAVGTAGAADFTGVSTTTLNFAAGVGAMIVTVPISITDDTLFENSEQFFVNLSNATNATIADAQGVGTITDNDPAPAFSIGDVTVNEAAGTATFTVTRTGDTALASTVDYATATGTAGAADFTGVGTTPLTFAAGVGMMTVIIPITIADDTLFEGSEQFFVNLSNATNATIADAQGVGTIVDNDAAPAFSINDVTVNEGAGTATFTVTRTGDTALASTVDYATATGTAGAADFTGVGTTTLNFAAGVGVMTVTIPISITNDTLLENSEQFFVNLSNATNATIADAQGVGTITDNDGAPEFSIDDVTVNEAAGTATFTVTRTGDTALASTVDYATATGTAGATDFTGVGTTTLTFAAGVGAMTVTIPISISDDTLFEGSEQFFVNLSNATNATIADAQGVGTITDNDPAPAFSIDDVTVNEAAGTATFTVTRTGDTALASTVDYATATGTAGAADFTGVSTTTLNFAAGVGAMTVTIPIGITNDTLFENSEQFFVNLSNATNATIADAQGIGTITDNDPAPEFSINDVTVNEGVGTATFTVTRTGDTALASTVDYATATGTAGAADFTGVGTTTLNFAAGVGSMTITIPISITDDTLFENTEQFFVNLSNATNATIADAQGVGTITDKDPAPAFSIDDVTVNEGAGTATFTVTRTGDTALASTVDYATAVGTAGAADFTGVSTTTLNFAAGVGVMTVTIPITIANDTLFEGSEQFFVNLSNATNATIADAQGVGTIVDDGTVSGPGGIPADDDRPTLSVSGVTVTEGTDPFAVFSVSLSNPSTTPVSFALALANISATGAGTDYGTAGAGNLQVSTDGGATWTDATIATIAPGTTSVLVRTPITDDLLDEGLETFTLTATRTEGTTTNLSILATATIIDNDAPFVPPPVLPPTVLPPLPTPDEPQIEPEPAPFFFAFDSFNNFATSGEAAIPGGLVPALQSIDVWRPTLLPLAPIYSGEADPGATLVIELYNANGVRIASQMVLADAGGNWLANFGSAVLRDAPSDVRITQVNAPYAFGMGTGHNLRTYYAPAAINPGHFLSQGTDLDLGDESAPLLGGLDLANPLQLGPVKYGAGLLPSGSVASGN